MSLMATREHKAFQSVQHRSPALGDMSGALIFGFSWLLVMATGLAPLAEAALTRSPSETVLLDGLGAAHLWPDRDLAFAVRHVARDHPCCDPAGVTPRTNRSLAQGDTSVSRIVSGPVRQSTRASVVALRTVNPCPLASDKGRDR